MNICLIGNTADRERFAYEAQAQHGFIVIYNLEEYESVAGRKDRFVYLGYSDVSGVDLQRLRSFGTLVFVSNEAGCACGDFIFRAGSRSCDYSVAQRDLILALTDDEINAAAQA